MLLTMNVVNSNGECASPHYDNTVQPRLSRFLDYPDLFLCSKIFVNINLFYFVSTAKLFSFKLCTMWTEFIALQSTNLYTFCTLTDRVHFTELWLAKICSVAEGNFTYSSLNYAVLFLAHEYSCFRLSRILIFHSAQSSQVWIVEVCLYR